MSKVLVPDTPAALFAADGSIIGARPVVCFGLSRHADLPTELRRELDARGILYRVVPVASPGVLVMYEPFRVLVGREAILGRLGAISERTPLPTQG
jgi:hypothetical protein